MTLQLLNGKEKRSFEKIVQQCGKQYVSRTTVLHVGVLKRDYPLILLPEHVTQNLGDKYPYHMPRGRGSYH